MLSEAERERAVASMSAKASTSSPRRDRPCPPLERLGGGSERRHPKRSSENRAEQPERRGRRLLAAASALASASSSAEGCSDDGVEGAGAGEKVFAGKGLATFFDGSCVGLLTCDSVIPQWQSIYQCCRARSLLELTYLAPRCHAVVVGRVSDGADLGATRGSPRGGEAARTAPRGGYLSRA